MRLLRLIADFRLLEARLLRSLTCDTDMATRVTLTRNAALLMDRIERFDPESREQLRCKIDFYLDRARRLRDQRALDLALSLIQRLDAGALLPARPCISRSCQPHEVLTRVAARGIDAARLSPMVSDQTHRTSLIDTSFRHVCTSRGNAEFHGRTGDSFVGQHMRDLIGAVRHDTRCGPQMARCLAGQKVAYYYPLDVPALGTRVMQCAMHRWQRPDGETAGLVLWINDVTDRLTGRHGFGDLPVA